MRSRQGLSAASFLSRYEGLRTRLPGDRAARDAAASALREAGLPGPRDEAWKYTSLKAITEAGFHEPLTTVGDPERPAPDLALDALGLPDLPRLVFADGRYREDLSKPSVAVGTERFGLSPIFSSGHDGQPLVSLNTMLAEDGAALSLDAGVDGGTVLLVSLGASIAGTPAGFHPRHRIRLARGAKLTLIEIAAGHGTYLHNPVVEIDIAAGARLSHVRLQAESHHAFHLATIFVDIAEGGVYDGFCLNIGALLSRTEIHARLGGPNAAAHLNGAQLLRGRQHGDFTTIVSHDAPNCASRQTVKSVLDGHAHGVFQGKIEVARAAQKTDGYQMNQALLLSPDSEINSKPQLEIYADDVKCSHGATVGALDPEQLFYLRSRGVPFAEARSILVHAFLAEAIEPVTDQQARALLERAIAGWWEEAA